MKSKFEIVECARCEKKFQRTVGRDDIIVCNDCWNDYRSDTNDTNIIVWCTENHIGPKLRKALDKAFSKIDSKLVSTSQD